MVSLFFYDLAFAAVEKNHYSVDSSIHLLYNRPQWSVVRKHYWEHYLRVGLVYLLLELYTVIALTQILPKANVLLTKP